MAPNQIVFEKLLCGDYRASLGQWTGTGKTKEEAQADLLAIFTHWPRNTYPITRKDAQGHVWVLWYEGRSWIYQMPSGCTSTVNGDRNAALRAMDTHIAQYYT